MSKFYNKKPLQNSKNIDLKDVFNPFLISLATLSKEIGSIFTDNSFMKALAPNGVPTFANDLKCRFLNGMTAEELKKVNESKKNTEKENRRNETLILLKEICEELKR